MKPIIFEAKKAHREKIVVYSGNGTAIINLKGKKFKVPKNQQFDLTQATIFGLNERLTLKATSPKINKNGETLRDAFNREWENYESALRRAKGSVHDYGVYAYYAEWGHLVRFAPAPWHRVVSVASSSRLITDPAAKMTWKEIRDVFDKTTVAVAGASVGNNCLHNVVMDLRPGAVKIADKSSYKMENINRVRLGYSDIADSNFYRKNATDTLLRNKAKVTASQIYAIDPFIYVYVYDEGLNEKNIKKFLGGGKGEPKANVILEEVDDPRVKLFVREAARKMRIPLVMVTDVGSAVQLDVLQYDRDYTLPLSYGISDEDLYAAMGAVYDNPGNRAIFYKFVDALIGADYRQDELGRIIEGKSEIPTSTIIPQLGSTAAVAGGIAAEAVARIRLGHIYPPRMIFNKRTFAAKVYQWKT